MYLLIIITLLLLSGIILHRFPNPDAHPEKFAVWISNIGGEIATFEKTYVYFNRRVCRKHFEVIHLYPSNRLSRMAIPVLHLQGESSR